MSSVFYPVSLIETLKVDRTDRTIADDFSDGGSAARATWPLYNFKRKFELKHAPLTIQEYRYLRSFHSQRTGMYDSFWFRDNVHREGNAQVRFYDDFKPEYSGSGHLVTNYLEEIAPVRALVEWDEIATAAGSSAVAWYDANREVWYMHLGAVKALEPAYDSMLTYPAPWQGGSALNLGGTLAQYQYYKFTGTEYAKTLINIAELTGSNPACTIFTVCRFSTASAHGHQLVVVGSGNDAYGLFIQSGSAFGAGTLNGTTTNFVANANVDAWQTVAAAFKAGGAQRKLYVNASLAGTDTHSYTWAAGPAVIGAYADGTNIVNPSNAMANANMAHVLVFSAELSLAQVKAVHNLLAYQFGIATVA